MSPSPPPRSLAPVVLGALVTLSCMLSMAGCVATLEPRPVVVSSQEEDVTWRDSGPVNVEQYPHESYGGRDVYLVGGSWQYRSGNRWATYRREPSELGRRRAQATRRQPEPERGEHR